MGEWLCLTTRTIHSHVAIYKLSLFHSYYMEILHQEHVGEASVNVGLFREESGFSEYQTNDAVNEVQSIVAQYDLFDEEQVCGG